MNRALSIALVCFPSLGGSGVVASELAMGLAKRGHRVRVLASSPLSRPLPACDRLSFHQVAVPSYPLFEHAPYTLALASKLIELARQEPLDVLHVHYAVPHAASALLAKQALGESAPCVITTLHGTDVTRVGSDPAYQAVTRFTVESSDAITVPSAYLEHAAHEQLGIPRSRAIEVIANFVDTEHFAPGSQSSPRDPSRLAELLAQAGCHHEGVSRQAAGSTPGPVLFHASNFRAVKRVGDLIEVLVRVRKQLPARLLLVGDGPERALAEQRARELGVNDHVCFLGRRAEFVPFLQQADVFLLPSETESFGLAALEAMSVGVPVCGYRVGGLPEVVDEASGRLSPAFEIEALAASVLDVVSHPDRQAMLGRAARARVLAHFTPEPAIARYEDLYRRTLSARAIRSGE
jgi:N-acetyl-alpha-D-glucosaminyl L-malate synthase BshA